MSTLQRKLPEVLSLIDGVDTIIIDRPILLDGSVQPSGEFKISNEVPDGNKTARLTSTDDDNYHQNMNFVVKDNTGMILLDSSYAKRSCFTKVLNVCSPAGFFLGSVKERYVKDEADYEIHTANESALYLVTMDTLARAITITLKNSGQTIAKVSWSPTGIIGKVRFTITYLENITTVHKLLIMCAVLACFEKHNAYQFTNNICNTLQDWFCCPLFRYSKVGCIILCILYPVILPVYLLLLLLYCVLNTVTCYLCMFLEPSEYPLYWPCMLCGYDHSFQFREFVVHV